MIDTHKKEKSRLYGIIARCSPDPRRRNLAVRCMSLYIFLPHRLRFCQETRYHCFLYQRLQYSGRRCCGVKPLRSHTRINNYFGVWFPQNHRLLAFINKTLAHEHQPHLSPGAIRGSRHHIGIRLGYMSADNELKRHGNMFVIMFNTRPYFVISSSPLICHGASVRHSTSQPSRLSGPSPITRPQPHAPAV